VKRILAVILISFLVSTVCSVCSVTASLYLGSSEGVKEILSGLGLFALPGLFVGMIAGNASAGGSLSVVLPIAVIVNTVIYGGVGCAINSFSPR
jgi:hypothetical protein